MPYKDKKQQKEYQRIWIKQRRLEYLEDKSCVECGEEENEILEVDHIDWRTKVSHRIWSWSQPRLMEELAKCQILCRPCHQEKSKRDVQEMWDEIRDRRV